MSLTRALPVYRSHKLVSALKITRILPNPRGLELYPQDERYAPIEVNDTWVNRNKPAAPGYLVLDQSGQSTWCPASIFEADHHPLAWDTALPATDDTDHWAGVLSGVPRQAIIDFLSTPDANGLVTLAVELTPQQRDEMIQLLDLMSAQPEAGEG